MFLEALIHQNSTALRESFDAKVARIIDQKLTERHYDIIQKEFGFLNEKEVSGGDSLTRKFVHSKVNKDPTATLNNNNYKNLNGKLVRMGSVEKFNRNNAKNKTDYASASHVSHIEIAKRQQTNQRNAALGIDPKQKLKALGLTHRITKHTGLTNYGKIN